jgi:hypothetical protein
MLLTARFYAKAFSSWKNLTYLARDTLYVTSDSEIIFFLGAGASIPAGVSGVKGMVSKFIEKLERRQVKAIKDIVRILNRKNNDVDVDIELLLETIEKLENRKSDVMPLFYTKKNSTLREFEKLEVDTDVKLSTVLKQFVKEETGQKDLNIDYLKGLLAFTKFYRQLHIFSTNYDVCIERFAQVNYKSYFDGFFDGRWDATKFDNTGKDLYLYKLHGSVTWSRDEKGRYTRNEIAITHTTEQQINIVSGEKEVPLISYPGRKLEYFEPLFDLLQELKKRLHDSNLKYIFVIGYSFRDDHVRRLFQYAAEKNREFILFLVTPSAHEIYQKNLQGYKDIDFFYSSARSSFSEGRTSSLSGRVICLPYKVQNIVDSLYDTYLVELKSGLAQEDERWDECLKHFIACEYFDKVEDILKERIGGLDGLMKSDYNLYELGWEITLKSLLNVLFLERERNEWSQKFKQYFNVLSNNIEARIDDQKKSIYILFKYSEDKSQKFGGDIYALFRHLSQIHDSHPIFSNEKASEKMNLTGLNISEMLNYFSIWQKETVSFYEYIKKRGDKYPEDISEVKKFAENTSLEVIGCLSAVREIEQKEMLSISS